VNGTLKSAAEWREARDIVRAAGLQPYEKPAAKSWDALRACNLLLASVPRTRPVLDAGGLPDYSYISSWLAHYGFSVDVITLGIRDDCDAHHGRVRFRRGDATRSGFADATFGAVTCLSVIEHGVAIEPFFAEMERILAPGGYLIVSTDFWETPVDTRGQTACGAPLHVFTPPEIEEMLTMARKYRLHPTGIIDYRCQEPVVEWFGVHYTFIDFALQRWPN